MRLIDADALKEALMMYTWYDEDGWEIDDAEAKREYIKGWLPDIPTVMTREAIELLKEQEAAYIESATRYYSAGYEDGIKHTENQDAVEPIRSKDADVWYCGNCDEIVGEETLTVGGIQDVRHKYCPECGRKVKWNATD